MASIERTAYPRFKRHYTSNELGEIYTPTRTEIAFALKVTTGEDNYFNLLVLLKVFQRLGYFPQIADIHLAIIDHIRAVLHLREGRSLSYQYPPTLSRHKKAIRSYLQVIPFNQNGTKYDLYEQNLLSEYHIRYGGYGGIAYHHVADSYIALFSHFIPCGTWEAVYIIEGLLKNTSEIQPNIIYADTQGQSTSVFALSYLLGIQLMPRIRNWQNLVFYRPDKETVYQHIDSLFKGVINWELIKTHWPDLLRVVLSIQSGKISSDMLLRKLGNYSRKNKLYQAFRELGRVIRTIFLLRNKRRRSSTVI